MGEPPFSIIVDATGLNQKEGYIEFLGKKSWKSLVSGKKKNYPFVLKLKESLKKEEKRITGANVDVSARRWAKRK